MTDKTPISQKAAAEGTPSVRRISTPRPKKQAKVAKPEAPVVDVSVSEVAPPANDWPEPEAASIGGGASAAENPKRKRRRKKGKGGNKPQESVTRNDAEFQDTEGAQDSTTPSLPSQTQAPRPHPQPRIKLDANAVAKLAWKIYLAEVSEEGVALIGDNDAKELTRRCFRLSEIFLEEQSRRG